MATIQGKNNNVLAFSYLLQRMMLVHIMDIQRVCLLRLNCCGEGMQGFFQFQQLYQFTQLIFRIVV